MSFAKWLRELAIGWIKLKKLSFDLLLKWTETRPMALFRVSKHPNGPVRRAELVMVSCTSNVNFLLKRTRFRNKANFLDMTSKAGQVQWQAILLLFRSKQFWHFVPLKNDLAQIKVFSCFNWSTKRAFLDLCHQQECNRSWKMHFLVYFWVKKSIDTCRGKKSGW